MSDVLTQEHLSSELEKMGSPEYIAECNKRNHANVRYWHGAYKKYVVRGEPLLNPWWLFTDEEIKQIIRE